MTAITRRLLGLFAAAGLVATAACNMQTLNLSEDKDKAAREIYVLVRDGDMAKLAPRLGPEMQGPEAEAALVQMRAAIPTGEPTKSRVASWKTNWEAGQGETLEVDHEYTYPERIVDAKTILTRAKKDAPWMVRGFHLKWRAPGDAPSPDGAGASVSTEEPAPAAPAAAPAPAEGAPQGHTG